jgi:hypothetical protein
LNQSVLPESFMAASWITIVAPYLPEIIRLARPMFTRTPVRDANTEKLRLDVLNEQIAELQNAATQNADSIKLLATEMQKTIEVLQLGAERLEQRSKRSERVAIVAATIAALSFALAVFALTR